MKPILFTLAIVLVGGSRAKASCVDLSGDWGMQNCAANPEVNSSDRRVVIRLQQTRCEKVLMTYPSMNMPEGLHSLTATEFLLGGVLHQTAIFEYKPGHVTTISRVTEAVWSSDGTEMKTWSSMSGANIGDAKISGPPTGAYEHRNYKIQDGKLHVTSDSGNNETKISEGCTYERL